MGTITIAGHDIVTDGVEAKRQLAFMADEPQLFDYLTVTEHLQLTARIYRRGRRVACGGAARGAGADGKEQALPAELSRGMKQKVAIACGLLHDPAALLFDEPLTGLDPLGIRRMKETIVARGRSGGAVIVSSHMLHLVEEICTRVVIIDRGRRSRTARLPSCRRRPKWPEPDRGSSRSSSRSPRASRDGIHERRRRVLLPDGVLDH